MNRKERRKNKVITNPQAILNITNHALALTINGELDKAEIFYKKVLKVDNNSDSNDMFIWIGSITEI